MAVYFEGNAYIDECHIQNTDITDCIITNSSLDMNLENITNVKDPILPQDAATKEYVDSRVNGFTTTNVNLVGTIGSLAFSIQKGNYFLKVNNLVTNGPSALFQIVKSEANRAGQVNRLAATTGLSSDNTLFIDWGINDDIYLRKCRGTYDGSYSVVLI
jgi:hypothetical protein